MNTDEVERFSRFKNLVWSEITPSWCLKHGVECIEEIPHIAPMEVFFLGVRMGEVFDEGTEKIIERVGDRIPVSLGGDIAYLFPKDLYEKILIFDSVPS